MIGAINAYTARMAERTGFKALYLSGGGVAANSLGMPDLGISALEDVPPGTPLGAGVVSYDTYWAQSTDGGASFSSPLKVSSARRE